MAFLIDSNIIIYSYLPEYQYLRELITSDLSYVSEVSRVEVLGYHKLKDEEQRYFNDIFSLVTVILPSQEVFDKAIHIRKEFNLTLGDSLIASTGLVYSLTVYTRNVGDFEKIIDLNCVNPIR